MHIKLGLVSSLVAAATASLHGVELSSCKSLSTLYVKPNSEETCFTIRPVFSCDEQHVATHIKHQKVGFHCLDSNLPIAKKMVQEILEGKNFNLEHENEDMQAYVEVPTHCEKIDSETKALKKEIERNPEQRIHLIQPEDDVESICTGYNAFFDANHHNTFHKNENVADWLINEKLSNMKLTVHEILNMDIAKYENLMDTLKFVANQINQQKFSPENQLNQQISHALPNIFSKIAKKFFDTYVDSNVLSKAKTEEFYDQYKEIVKRVYAYVVKQILRTNNYSPYHSQYVQFSAVIRNTLAKINQELTDQEIQQVHKITNAYKQRTPLDFFSNINFDLTDKEQLKTIEKYLTKILVSGLVIAQNQYSKTSDEYKFNTQYDDLVQYLNSKFNNAKTFIN